MVRPARGRKITRMRRERSHHAKQNVPPVGCKSSVKIKVAVIYHLLIGIPGIVCLLDLTI